MKDKPNSTMDLFGLPYKICLKILIYVIKLKRFNYSPIWFLIYAYYQFNRIEKRKRQYRVKIVNHKTVLNLVKLPKNDLKPTPCDVNNTIVVNNKHIYKCDKLLKLFFYNSTNFVSFCYVFVVGSPDCPGDTVLMSETLAFNNNIKEAYVCKLKDHFHNLVTATELDLRLIHSPLEVSDPTYDSLLVNYFAAPKIVKRDQIIKIDVREYGDDVFYLNERLSRVDYFYFKCNKIFVGDKIVEGPVFCVKSTTTLKQSINIGSFIPKILTASPKECTTDSEIDNCPFGLKKYFDSMEKSVVPFLKNRKINLWPLFLVQGEKGCGKEVLTSSLAAKLGMHYFKINHSHLSANIYAQNEMKLKSTLFNAKLAAPCLVSIQNFENFGRNNENHYDERLISNFEQELSNLFESNIYPVVVFCCFNGSSCADMSSELRRLFLEVFEVKSPNDAERADLLKWILQFENILYNVNLNDVANKTHGFFFDDLKALVYHAKSDFINNIQNCTGCATLQLNASNFDKAIDLMQASYSESLGAPKVPKVQWADVGGLVDVKEEIIKTINLPLKNPHFLKMSGLKRTGILLFGPPGTGKTLIAKAVATECNLCFLSVKGPELLNMYVGQSEQNVREVFEKARQASPCVIFFDELDSLAPNRGINGDSGGVMDRVVSQLLAEMDGLNDSASVFIIGATNRPDLIDPALLRPGRFDKLLYIGPCVDAVSKASVLKALTRKFNFKKDINLDEIVGLCPPNITGADFYGICSNAWANAVRKLIVKIENGDIKDGETLSSKDVIVGLDDFKQSIRNVKPSIGAEDLLYFEKLKNELASNCS